VDDDLSSGNKLRIPTQLPEVVTPYTRTARREREKEREGGWKNQVEFIVTIDSGGYVAYVLTLAVREGEGRGRGVLVYKFLRLPMKPPEALKRADLLPDPSRTAAFAESLLSLSLSLYFLHFCVFFSSLPLLFSRYSPPFFFSRALRIAGNLINREFFVAAAAPCRPRDGLAVLFAPFGSKYSGGLF